MHVLTDGGESSSNDRAEQWKSHKWHKNQLLDTKIWTCTVGGWICSEIFAQILLSVVCLNKLNNKKEKSCKGREKKSLWCAAKSWPKHNKQFIFQIWAVKCPWRNSWNKGVIPAACRLWSKSLKPQAKSGIINMKINHKWNVLAVMKQLF